MFRRLQILLGAVLCVLVFSVPLYGQGGPFSAQLENFWRLIATGGRTFTNISVSGGTISGVTISATTATANKFCLDVANADAFWGRVGANDIGVFTGSCAGAGTLRFDVSATAVTSAVPIQSPNGTAAAPSLTFTSDTTRGFFFGGSTLQFTAAGSARGAFGAYVTMAAAGGFGWSSTSDPLGTQDIFLRRSAAKTLTFDTDGANGPLTAWNLFATTATITGTLNTTVAYQANGTPITSGTTHLSAGSGMAVANVGANSCGTTAATIAGNNNAWVITVGATSGTQCRVAFTFAASTEWDCAANDDTTTVAVRVTPVDTTHTDVLGAFTAGDKIGGVCFPR